MTVCVCVCFHMCLWLWVFLEWSRNVLTGRVSGGDSGAFETDTRDESQRDGERKRASFM